jgi:phage N-6-adenine-methyltransferase
MGDAATTAQAAIEVAGNYRQAARGFRAEDRHYPAASASTKAKAGLPSGRASSSGCSLIAQQSYGSAEGKSINTGGRGCSDGPRPFFTTMQPAQKIAEPASRRSVHFSSASAEWATPQSLFDELSWLFGGFTLDPCATPQNAKCKTFFTREQNGLAQLWEGKVFMNPPYGREIGLWVKKAFEESRRGALVVCLLPARTDTRWWQDYAKRGHVFFLRGRLRFGDAKHTAPFPSAIVTFGSFFS